MASFRIVIKLTDLSTALLFFCKDKTPFLNFPVFFKESNANKHIDDK